jgi:hypothetical protein
LIAPYEFTMEKLLFVVRSLKERLVINLESLLLHGNEDLREPDGTEPDRTGKIRGKKSILSAYGTQRKSDFGKT